MHPNDMPARGVSAGDVVVVPIGGVPRRLTVRSSEAVPEGVCLVPTLPDQPVGVTEIDFAALAIEPKDRATERVAS
jgi:hypothetical protein